MKRRSKLVLILATLLALTLIFAACTKAANDPPKSDSSEQQPSENETYEVLGTDFGEFTTTDLNGDEVTNEIFKDKKVTMIFLWGTG